MSSLFSECPTEPVQYADLIFILDQSVSVGGDAVLWRSLIDFMITVISRLNVGPNNVRVGLIRFDDQARVDIPLGSISDRGQLIAQFRALQQPARPGATNLQAAVTVASEQFEKIAADRSGANDIVIIFTDGFYSSGFQVTIDAIERLQETGEGVHIIPVAVLEDLNLRSLERLANTPGSNMPAVVGRDYFLDTQLRTAQMTIDELFMRKLRPLLDPVCVELQTSSKCVWRFKSNMHARVFFPSSVTEPIHVKMLCKQTST